MPTDQHEELEMQKRIVLQTALGLFFIIIFMGMVSHAYMHTFIASYAGEQTANVLMAIYFFACACIFGVWARMLLLVKEGAENTIASAIVATLGFIMYLAEVITASA